MSSSLVPVIIAAAAVVILIVLFKLMWRVAEPNEAMIISGLSGKGSVEGTEESISFRIVTGKGTLVIPGVQQVRSLKLDLRNAPLDVTCVTTQGIPVRVQGVVIFKIADDLASIANAARRFLSKQDTLEARVHNVFAGHLRSIIGGLTVEQLIRDRDALTQRTRDSAAPEMAKLGFLLESLTIQEIDDPTGYIENLAKPHIAQVTKDARIAQAQNDRLAAEQEAEAKAQIAEAQRDSNIKQADAQARVQETVAKANQAGPLAEAQARQAVVQQETEVAKLNAERTERELDATVRKPADANNYQRIKSAEAERQAQILAAEADAQQTKLNAEAQSEQTRKIGQAEGDAIAAKGKAEGEALKARAEGLAQNQEAVIGQQLAGNLAEIVKAAASAFDHVDNLTVLNGAEGLGQALNSIVAQSLTSLGAVRSALAQQNGKAEEKDKVTMNLDPETNEMFKQ